MSKPKFSYVFIPVILETYEVFKYTIVRFQEVITIHMYIFHNRSLFKNTDKSHLSDIITLIDSLNCNIYYD